MTPGFVAGGLYAAGFTIAAVSAWRNSRELRPLWVRVGFTLFGATLWPLVLAWWAWNRFPLRGR